MFKKENKTKEENTELVNNEVNNYDYSSDQSDISTDLLDEMDNFNWNIEDNNVTCTTIYTNILLWLQSCFNNLFNNNDHEYQEVNKS